MIARSIEPVGPPYLDNTLGELTLTTGFRPPAKRPGNSAAGVLTSADGVAWATVATLPRNFGSGHGPASAGSASDRVVVIPRIDRRGFLVSIAGSTPASRPILGSYGVGLSKGPGPISATTHACAANPVVDDANGERRRNRIWPASQGVSDEWRLRAAVQPADDHPVRHLCGEHDLRDGTGKRGHGSLKGQQRGRLPLRARLRQPAGPSHRRLRSVDGVRLCPRSLAPVEGRARRDEEPLAHLTTPRYCRRPAEQGIVGRRLEGLAND